MRHNEFLIFLVSAFLANLLPATAAGESDTTATGANNTIAVTILGLGPMGQALVRCLSSSSNNSNGKSHPNSQDYHIHAWNRSPENRQAVRDFHAHNPRVTVHDNVTAAVEAAPIIIMTVVGDPDLQAATHILQSVDSGVWTANEHNKILIQFSSHEPTGIEQFQTLCQSLGIQNLVAGAMLGSPDAVCTPDSQYYISVDEDDKQGAKSLFRDVVTPLLSHLGEVVYFPGGIAMSSLADIAFMQTLMFGLAGQQLSLLAIRRYTEQHNNSNIVLSDEFRQTYRVSMSQVVPRNIRHYDNVVMDAIWNKAYQEERQTFMPSHSILLFWEMHATFFRRMGIVVEDTYLGTYLQALRRLPEDGRYGPSAIVEYYKTEQQQQDNNGRDTAPSGTAGEL